jgi:hypothetical protein
LPNYNLGLIKLAAQYNTIGIIGLYEALQKYGFTYLDEFNNTYYFVSFSDGNLYEMNSKYTTFNGEQIPRIRVCPPVRTADQSQFIVNELCFTIEQGENSFLQRVDLSIARNGNDFSNIDGPYLNVIPGRTNMLRFRALGMANDFVPQFRFWGNGRFVFTDGLVRIYQ